MWLAFLIVKCLKEKNNWDGHPHKLYAGTYGGYWLLGMDELTGNVHDFMENWVGEKLASRPVGNISRVFRTLINGEKHLESQKCVVSGTCDGITPYRTGLLHRKSKTFGCGSTTRRHYYKAKGWGIKRKK